MIVSAPTARDGQELNQDHHKSKSSKIPKKPKAINREATLEAIAEKWASQGLYASPSRALIALLEGIA